MRHGAPHASYGGVHQRPTFPSAAPLSCHINRSRPPPPVPQPHTSTYLVVSFRVTGKTCAPPIVRAKHPLLAYRYWPEGVLDTRYTSVENCAVDVLHPENQQQRRVDMPLTYSFNICCVPRILPLAVPRVIQGGEERERAREKGVCKVCNNI